LIGLDIVRGDVALRTEGKNNTKKLNRHHSARIGRNEIDVRPDFTDKIRMWIQDVEKNLQRKEKIANFALKIR